MSFRAGLVEFLTDRTSRRFHPSVLPDKPELPAVVYRVISNVGAFAHDSPVPLRHVRVQLDAWSNRQSEVEEIAGELEAALIGYVGPMGGAVHYSAGWALEDSTDLFEQDSGLYRVSMDFRGWYRPPE